MTSLAQFHLHNDMDRLHPVLLYCLVWLYKKGFLALTRNMLITAINIVTCYYPPSSDNVSVANELTSHMLVSTMPIATIIITSMSLATVLTATIFIHNRHAGNHHVYSHHASSHQAFRHHMLT